MKPRRIPEICLPALIATVLSAAPALAANCGEMFFEPLIVSATPVSFGLYLPASGSPAIANGTITASCEMWFDELPSFTVALSAGAASGYNPRRMTSGTNQISYNLFTNSAHTLVWGDGSGASVTQDYNPSGRQRAVSFTAYGEIPALQRAAAGNYTDTIIATITY